MTNLRSTHSILPTIRNTVPLCTCNGTTRCMSRIRSNIRCTANIELRLSTLCIRTTLGLHHTPLDRLSRRHTRAQRTRDKKEWAKTLFSSFYVCAALRVYIIANGRQCSIQKCSIQKCSIHMYARFTLHLPLTLTLMNIRRYKV
jgi:hypothetical protein